MSVYRFFLSRFKDCFESVGASEEFCYSKSRKEQRAGKTIGYLLEI